MKNVFANCILCLFIAPIATIPTPAIAQDRPSEDAMFGGSKTTTKASPTPTPTAETTEIPLQIGGKLYQRFIVAPQQGVTEENTPVSAPTQFDLFLDSRPNDRLRGFLNQRILYDSTRDQYSNTSSGSTFSSLPTSSTLTNRTPNNPQTVLDQAWVKFDIEHSVFVTVGKQHVKWGVSRFWNPTDFLSAQRRDPLLTTDTRLGSSMAKFEIPFEKNGTNLYGILLFDNPQPASTLGKMGAALRGETVFGETEMGLDLVTRGSRSPSYGADISSSLGPFDAYLEASYLTSAPSPTYRLNAQPTTGADISTLYSANTQSGSFTQLSGGLNYSFPWKENRLATIGVEYFYNPLGYTDPAIYPVLIFLGQYQPFYLGRDYAGLYITMEGPDAQRNTSYTFSTLGNISDKSFISRLDFNWRVLTYMTFEAFAAAHYGGDGGEFNFSLNTPQMTYQGSTISAIRLPRTMYELGVALSIGF